MQVRCEMSDVGSCKLCDAPSPFLSDGVRGTLCVMRNSRITFHVLPFSCPQILVNRLGRDLALAHRQDDGRAAGGHVAAGEHALLRCLHRVARPPSRRRAWRACRSGVVLGISGLGLWPTAMTTMSHRDAEVGVLDRHRAAAARGVRLAQFVPDALDFVARGRLSPWKATGVGQQIELMPSCSAW